MPFLEVMYSTEQPASERQKRALAQAAEQALAHILQTPAGRMRLAISYIPPHSSVTLLQAPPPTPEHPAAGHEGHEAGLGGGG